MGMQMPCASGFAQPQQIAFRSAGCVPLASSSGFVSAMRGGSALEAGHRGVQRQQRCDPLTSWNFRQAVYAPMCMLVNALYVSSIDQSFVCSPFLISRKQTQSHSQCGICCSPRNRSVAPTRAVIEREAASTNSSRETSGSVAGNISGATQGNTCPSYLPEVAFTSMKVHLGLV